MDDLAYTALTQAIENFRPERSLHTQEDFDRFYVPRPLSPLAELAEQVRASSSQAKFLVYGHRGCGKTSELNALAHELRDTYFTIILSLEQENDLGDLHYTELLTSLCRAILYTAASHQVNVSKKLLDNVLKWFTDVEEVTEGKLSAEAAATQKISVIFAELFSQQKAEVSKREERRLKRQKMKANCST